MGPPLAPKRSGLAALRAANPAVCSPAVGSCDRSLMQESRHAGPRTNSKAGGALPHSSAASVVMDRDAVEPPGRSFLDGFIPFMMAAQFVDGLGQWRICERLGAAKHLPVPVSRCQVMRVAPPRRYTIEDVTEFGCDKGGAEPDDGATPDLGTCRRLLRHDHCLWVGRIGESRAPFRHSRKTRRTKDLLGPGQCRTLYIRDANAFGLERLNVRGTVGLRDMLDVGARVALGVEGSRARQGR